MNRNRLLDEALAVAWIERSKGGYRAANVIELLLARVRELEEERQVYRSDALRAAMREDVEAVRKLMRAGPRYVIGEKLE